MRTGWRLRVARRLVIWASWICPTVEIRIASPSVYRREEMAERREARTKRTVWTGKGSKTRQDIIKVLRSRGPLTRREIDEHLDVTTSSLHLPRMVEDGVIVAVPVGNEKGYRPTLLYDLPTLTEMKA